MNLYSIAELAHRSIYPNSRVKPSVTLAEFIATAKYEYAAAMWLYRLEIINNEGSFDMPSDLLTEKEMVVKNDRIDISQLNYLSALPGDLWLQSVGGGEDCDCVYVKTTINLEKLLCDDDSGGDSKTYRVQGKQILFPKGTHSDKLPIVYANNGVSLDANKIEVNEYVASKVRLKLMQLYGTKQATDVTNNQNPNF